MKVFAIGFVTIMFFYCTQAAYANILVYPFDDPVKEQRFNHLINELRCPKCQNNNLADSNSGLALDLKNIIYEQLNDGRTDREITDYLKLRYGDFISYRPPLKPSTWLIWYGPFVFLFIGFMVIMRVVVTRSRSTSLHNPHAVSDKTQAVLSEWNKENSNEADLDEHETHPEQKIPGDTK